MMTKQAAKLGSSRIFPTNRLGFVAELPQGKVLFGAVILNSCTGSFSHCCY